MSAGRGAVWALAGTTLVWGSTFVVVRELVQPIDGTPPFPPFLLLTIRFAIAAALMTAVLFARGLRIDAVAWKRGTILGALTCGGFAFQTIGLSLTTSARSAFITNVSLVLVPGFGWFLGRGRPRAGLLLGLAVTLAGLWQLEFPWDAPQTFGGETHDEQQLLRGDLLTLGCAGFFAFQILVTESFAASTPILPLVCAQFTTCALLAAGLAAAFGEWTAPVPLPGGFPKVAAEILYLGALATGVCLLVQAWAQRYTSATRAALIFTLEPVFATALAYALLGERLRAAQWVGAVLVLLGILAAELLAGGPPAHDDAVRPLAPPEYGDEIRT